MRELLGGTFEDPHVHLQSVFTEKYDEIVLLRDIPFYSICEHHMLPFIGKAHVAYLPTGKVLGVSKLARIVDSFAHRLQAQERLTGQIADFLMQNLRPLGVAVVLAGLAQLHDDSRHSQARLDDGHLGPARHLQEGRPQPREVLQPDAQRQRVKRIYDRLIYDLLICARLPKRSVGICDISES